MRAASTWSRCCHKQLARDGGKDAGANVCVDDRVDEESPEKAFEVGYHSCLEHLPGRRFVEVEHPGANPVRREGEAEVISTAPRGYLRDTGVLMPCFHRLPDVLDLPPGPCLGTEDAETSGGPAIELHQCIGGIANPHGSGRVRVVAIDNIISPHTSSSVTPGAMTSTAALSPMSRTRPAASMRSTSAGDLRWSR